MKKKLEEVSVICDNCNSGFSPEVIAIKDNYTVIKGDKVRVIYYRCPNCNKIHVVGVHDYKADKMLKRQQELVTSNQKRVMRGLPVSKQKLEQIEIIKSDLLFYQKILKRQYESEFHLLDSLLP